MTAAMLAHIESSSALDDCGCEVDRNALTARLRYRAAFTLLELLVVIAIVGVIFGLLLSAVQKVRAGADRVSCANRLKQLATALHGYHHTHLRFPAGTSFDGGRTEMPFVNWHARVLPQLEQESLWREIQAAFAEDREFRNVPPHRGRSTVLPVYVCPADQKAASPPQLGELQVPIALTSYLGNEGLDLNQRNGVLFLDSRVRLADVTDGTSLTTLLGERPPSADGVFGWWYAGWGQVQTGSAESVLGSRERNVHYDQCPPGPYHFAPGRFDNVCDAFHFWSGHSSGGHFAFTDGSVRFLTYSAASVLPALSTRAGGEVVSVPE